MMTNLKVAPSQQQQCSMLGLLLEDLRLVGPFQTARAHLSTRKAPCLKVRDVLSVSASVCTSCLYVFGCRELSTLHLPLYDSPSCLYMVTVIAVYSNAQGMMKHPSPGPSDISYVGQTGCFTHVM